MKKTEDFRVGDRVRNRRTGKRGRIVSLPDKCAQFGLTPDDRVFVCYEGGRSVFIAAKGLEFAP